MRDNVKVSKRLLWPLLGCLCAAACSLPTPKGLTGDGGNALPTTCSLSPDAGATIVSTVEATGDAENVVPAVACGGVDAGASGSPNPNAIDKYSQGYAYNDPAILGKVDQTMANISLNDEAAQMYGMPYLINGGVQYNDIQRSQDTPGGGRGFRYRDASRGVNLGEDLDGVFATADFVNGQHVGYSTSFPVSMARGAAFDLDLEYAIGEAIGDEMQATGQTLLLAPCMNLLRHPLWGRAQETYGEDPYQIGRLASALVVGTQLHVAANAKHYMGYDIENHRSTNNSQMEDEQTLREIYGRHFRMVVQDSGVASVMASYNAVDMVKSTENAHTVTDILRNDFGFKGFVLSDWWAMPGDTTIPDTSTLNSNALKALSAGLDVELPWGLYYGQLQSLLANGQINKTTTLDVAARRVLYEKYRFNSDPTTGLTGLGKPVTVYTDNRISCDYTHLDLAKKAALESMVLLKNDMGALPISAAVKKVAVIGAKVPYVTNNGSPDQQTGGTVDFARDVRGGDLGSSRVFPDPKKSIGPFEGIQNTEPSGVTVVAGNTVADVPPDADFVVVVAGLTPQDEGEEYTGAGDRKTFLLDDKQDPNGMYNGVQNKLINDVAALGKPMVVVLEGGSVIDTTPWIGNLPASSAVVMAWYPGQRGGEALGDLLWGQVNGVSYNFSGKLPFTWGNLNDYDQFNGAGNSSSGGSTVFHYYVGYRWFDNKNIPLNPAQGTFPFGYGLSYTTFQYSKPQLGCSTMSQGAVLPVVVNITNTGTVAGDEIAMVFVSFPQTTARRGAKELKGFARVSLAAGETKQVTIPVRLSDLDYFQVDSTDPSGQAGHWVVETGPVKIMVGGSSANLPLTGMVNVNGYTVGSNQ
jgi:beta-glucosidase